MSDKDTTSSTTSGSSTSASDDQSARGSEQAAADGADTAQGSGASGSVPPPPPPPESSGAGDSAKQTTQTPAATESTSSDSSTDESESSEPSTAGSAAVSSDASSADESAAEQTQAVFTAGDYARTTTDSPDSTSVIPIVRDGPEPKNQSDTTAEVAQTSPSPVKAASGRRASLKIAHVDPWSVTKIAFALSVAMMIVAVIAVTILWVVLSVAGVWDQINSSVSTVLSDGSTKFEIQDYLGFGRIIGLTLILSAINVIVVTAITAIGTRLYNLGADLLGGIDVTFSED